MIDDQAQIRIIYQQQKKVSYSNICELFDLNFKKICRLIPLLPAIKDDYIAVKDSLNNLHLICHQKSPYTGTYTITHQFDLTGNTINRPDIRFKLYFDAQLLEVISVCKKTTINKYHPMRYSCSDFVFQWELNLFMLRWLEYCLDRYNGAKWQKNK